uniref:Uncharacterized protein n=1 Tax=Panagrolaimus superbus TaxID=310955 RepID=A0A914YSI7_9BILA
METTAATVERKYYMMPRTPYIFDSCSVITFGIGGDILSEQHIKMMLPQCTFLGFDPNGKYISLFEKDLSGKFIQAGVESKNGGNIILQSKHVIL